MSVTKEELNRIAQEYHEKDQMLDKHIEDECQYYTYDWVFSKLSPGDSVLEMGYGEGNFTEALVKRNFLPTVIDGSGILLDKAASLYGSRIKTVHALFEEYTPKDRFDCVLATHVLEHVDDPVALLKKMKTW